jgi:muramoyltetrapeptide carboxypeptidase
MMSSALSRGSPIAYLAGDDARRTRELEAALVHPDVKAIIAGRGGYGAMRVLERANLGPLVESPRWIVGFSDVTALHLMAAAAGVASVHGPNVTGLGRTSPANRAAWMMALERPHAPVVWGGLRVVHAATGAASREVRGQVYGGNLALLEAMAASGRLAVPEGCVLMLEDIDERPYRVDRMLTALRLGGHLSKAAAIVLGGFTRCAPGAEGTTVEEVLAERTHGLGVPVLSGAPFGHAEDNRAFVVGREAIVRGREVVFPG